MISKLHQRIHRAASRNGGTLGYPDVVANPQSRRRVVARQKEQGKFAPSDADTSSLTQVESKEREAEMRPLEFGLIARVFAYMRPYRARRNWLLLIVLVRSLQIPALAALFTHVINGPLVARDVRGTLLGAAGFLLLAIFTQVTLHFRSRWALELGEAVVHDLRRDVFAHLQKMTMSFYHQTPVGRIISRMTSDIEVIRSLVQDVLFMSMVNVGQMIFAAAVMFWYDRVLFLMILGLAPILWGLNFYFRRRLSKALRAAQESFSRVTSTLAESVSGIRVTQSFVRQNFNSRLFLGQVVDHSNFNMQAAQKSGALPPLLELNNQFFMVGLLLFGGYRILGPGVGADIAPVRAEALVGYYLMSATFFAPLATIGNIYNQALAAMAGAERVFHLLDTPPEFCDKPDAIVLPPIQGRVEFRDLSFGYDPQNPVLHHINFVAEPGQTIALVGHTGSGKSSLIQLISRFYLPTSGQLLIDGHEIRDIQSASLHRQMGIVSQVNFLFTGTVMENIRVGRPDATDEEVMEAARKLDVIDLIETMPEGFHASVGERGEGVSLGQRQIICFVRAMLANPRIMILDEATSSVDTMTELRLQNALATLLKDRTSFVVAHRLSTIQDADTVLVLDQGRIVERGNHHELLGEGGVYANLYRQFVQATTV
ncbi:MAG: ABC transporter ATP-binding protein/permease [Armatimonadetes bacterium]|nr:ABC transporter ATP-binding protein/permease [Armatimonadota bacterium]